jgi:maleylacetate reductase
MRAFVFPGLTTRVIFGHGTIANVADEIGRLGHKKALILSTPHQHSDAEALAARIGEMSAGVFAGAQMHTPIHVTQKAIAAFAESGATCVVALGGGSTTGLGKAIASRTGVDQIVIPTTYAGSEMTDILGETFDGEKTTRRGPEIRPETVIYDVDLTLTLPVTMTVTSALNAIAHGVEALYAPDANPVVAQMAASSFPMFKNALPVLLNNPHDLDARAQMLEAAWYCSTALGYVSMALHHKLCHVLGGSFGMPHAETHAVMIPHVTAFNAVAVGASFEPVRAVFGASPGAGLHDFAQACGAPMSLKALGFDAANLDRAADIAMQNSYANPRVFDRAAIRALLENAYDGIRPDA